MSTPNELDNLFEELTLDKVWEYPKMPHFTSYTHHGMKWWSYWGGYYKVPAHWNPKDKRMIVYYDSEGRIHRTSGPAYINPLYDEEAWYFEGKLHREGNWAYRHKGNFVWFKHGVLHNLEGPAVVEMAGPEQYWIDGVKYSRKQYKWEIERRGKKPKTKKT